MKIKRTLAILLTFVMVLEVLPLTSMFASADDEVTEYDLWIAGTRVTSETLADRPSVWDDTSYDPGSNTLTLGMDSVSTYYHDNSFGNAVVYTTMENLNIRGELCSYSADHCVYSTGGVTVVGDLLITSAGSAITASSLTTAERIVTVKPENGVFANGKLRMSDGTTVSANADFRIEAYYPLWVCGVQATSINRDDILGDGSVELDVSDIWFDPFYRYPTFGKLNFISKPTVSGSYENSMIYTNVMSLEIMGCSGLLLKTDAEYGILSDSTVRIYSDVTIWAKTCAIRAGWCTAQGVFAYPEGADFRENMVRDANGNAAPLVSVPALTAYDLWLGDTRVFSLNSDDILGDGKASFDPDTNTLSLRGTPAINGTREGSLIYANGFHLTVDGVGTVAGNADYAVYCTGDLTVDGNVTLAANTAAIRADGELSLGENCRIELPANGSVAGGTVMSSGVGALSVAILKGDCFNLWIGAVCATSYSVHDVLYDGTVSFDPDTNTLTLNGTPDILGTHEGSLIYYDGVRLTLAGTGTVAGSADYAVRCTGDLTLDGNFVLTANTAAILAGGSLSLGSKAEIELPDDGTFANGTVMYAGGPAASVTIFKGDRYNLWVGSVRVTSNNAQDVLNDGGKVRFDPGTGTLTLNGTPDIAGTHEESLIYGNGFPLTVVGAGTVEGNAMYAVYCTGDLMLSGEFSFAANIAAVMTGGVLSLGTNTRINTPTKAEIDNGTVFPFGSTAPAAVVTTIGPEYYDLWIGSTRVSTFNQDDILNDGGKAVYDPDTNTLTLNEPVIEGSTVDYNGWSCKIRCRINGITLAGSYHMTNDDGCDAGLRMIVYGGIYAAGDFLFRGQGAGVYSDESLTVAAGTFKAAGGRFGLLTYGNLTVENNVSAVTLYGSAAAYVYGESIDQPFVLGESQSVVIPEQYDTDGYILDNHLYHTVTFTNLYYTTGFKAAHPRIRIASEPAELWVGRTRVTDENMSDVLGDGSVSFDPVTDTLTMNSPADGFGFHTLSDGSRARIYAKNMDLTVNGSFHTSLTATAISHEYDAVVDNGNLTINGDFTFRGTEVGVVADNVIFASGAFQAKGDAYTAVRTGILMLRENVTTAGFHGGVTAIETSKVSTYRDYFSCSGKIINGRIYDGYGRVMTDAAFYKATVFYNLWLGDTQVHEFNKDDILGDRTARFYPETNTLELKGTDITFYRTGIHTARIRFEGFDLTLTGSAKCNVNNTHANGGIYCPDAHSLTTKGYFEFGGKQVGISVYDLNVCPANDDPDEPSGGVCATGGYCGISLGGKLTVDEKVEYLYMHATDPDYHVAIEARNGVQIDGTRAQIIPENVELDVCRYSSPNYGMGTVTSYFLPGAETVDENNMHHYDLTLCAGEIYWGTDYQLTVGDRRVTSVNYSDIFGDGRAVYDPSAKTLTLNEPTINGSDDRTGGSSKIAAWDIDLTVKGSYHMTDRSVINGIYVSGGSLTLDGDFTFFGTSSAIYAQNGVRMTGAINAQVTVNSFYSSAAIRTLGGVSILAGSLNVGGGKIGIYCPNGPLTIYAPGTESVILDGSEKALYAGGLVFEGNTGEKEFVIASPKGAKFIGKTIDLGYVGGYAIVPAKHAEFLPTSCIGLWVNGKSVNPENCGDIFGDGKAVYNPDTHTLTLTDAEYSGAYNGAVIYATGIDLTVTGRARLTGAEYGIRVDGGSLTVNGVFAENGSGTVGNVTGSVAVQINGIICSGSTDGIRVPDGAVTMTGKVSVSGADHGVNTAEYLNASGEIDVHGNTAAVRAENMNFLYEFGIVSPAVWSFDYVEKTVLDENGDAAKDVSIRHLVRYGLWLGRIEVTSLNCTDVFGDGRAVFDPETNILTLCDPTIPGVCTSLRIASKIAVSGRDLTIRGSYHMASDDGCLYGLQNVGGTLVLDGFFTFRGTWYGVHSDRHVTVRGELTAISADGIGISILGDAADGLELLQSYVTQTTVTAEGGEHAVSIGSTVLLPQDGLDLIEPADGRIDYYTKRILDANGDRSTRAVLRVDRLADGKGTQAQPFFIMNGYNWSALADEIEKGLDTSGMYFVLIANVNITTMLGTNFYPFSGIFNGNGLGNGAYTLYLDLERDAETAVAPFRYIAGATVKNLIVEGSVKGADASGLVGRIVGDGNLIENCDVRASVGTQTPTAAGLVLDGGAFRTSVVRCTFSGGIYGFTVQTNSGSSGSSDTHGNLSVEINMAAPGSLAATLWAASAAGATVTLTDCLDLSSSGCPVGQGDGTVSLTNVYYTAASKADSAQSVWNTVKRAYTVTGVDITLTKGAGYGVTYGGAIYAAEGETISFTTNTGDTVLAVSGGTLTQNGENAALTVPAANVSVYRLTDLRFDIHYTENITGGIVYPSRIRTCAGDTVRVYFMPQAGYIPDTVTVVDAQNTPIAVQTDENGNPCFTMPAGEVYLVASFKMKYSYNAETGELRLLCGEFGETTNSRWAQSDAQTLMNVTSVTAEPGVRFVGGMAYLFNSFVNCVSFDLHNVDVSGVTSVWRMFSGCRSMTSLDITGWNLLSVTDAHDMFNGCTALETFSLSLLSGVPLTNINGLLAGCTSLASVDLTALDPAELPSMDGIFSGCSNLHEITLAPGMSVTPAMALNNNGWGWVADGTYVILCAGDEYGTFTAPAAETTYRWTTDVYGPKYTFDETTGALTLRWGEFNPSDDLWVQIRNNKSAIMSVTALNGVSLVGDCGSMFFLFSNCTSIDLSEADVSGMTGMSDMFGFCVNLTRLDLANWDTSLVEDMSGAFRYCSRLTALDVAFWNTRSVTDMTAMFEGCSGLTSIDLSRFDTASLACAEEMFEMCTSLVRANLSGWDLSGVESLDSMFCSCENLRNLNLKGWKTTNVINMNNMFCGCAALKALDLSHFDVSSVIGFNGMFSDCSSLTSLNLSGWNTSAATDMFNMFGGCSSLTTLSLSHFDTSNIELMSCMFLDCSSLVSLNLSGFDTSKIMEISEMFAGCASLETLDLSGFTLAPYYDVWSDEYSDPCVFGLFDGTAALKAIILPAGFAVTEEMCLSNGDVNDPGWVVQGDQTLTVVSGTEEYAVIAAPVVTTAFVLKTAIALHPLSCDVNGDGEVNVLDVSALLDLLAENEENDLAYDLNDDGNVSVSDVSYLLDYLATMH